MPVMKLPLRCACEAAETIMRGSFSSFCTHEPRYAAEFSNRTESRMPASSDRNAAPNSPISSSLEYRSEPILAHPSPILARLSLLASIFVYFRGSVAREGA